MPPLDLSILLRFHPAGKTPEEKRIKRRALPLNAKWGRGGAGWGTESPSEELASRR